MYSSLLPTYPLSLTFYYQNYVGVTRNKTDRFSPFLTSTSCLMMGVSRLTRTYMLSRIDCTSTGGRLIGRGQLANSLIDIYYQGLLIHGYTQPNYRIYLNRSLGFYFLQDIIDPASKRAQLQNEPGLYFPFCPLFKTRSTIGRVRVVEGTMELRLEGALTGQG